MISLTPLAAIGGVSFSLALAGTLRPGPLPTVTVSEAARRGVCAGPLLLLITGHAVLELFLVIAILKGLGPFLRAVPVIGSIALIGGLMLLWMGIDMLRKAGALSLAGGCKERGGPRRRPQSGGAGHCRQPRLVADSNLKDMVAPMRRLGLDICCDPSLSDEEITTTAGKEKRIVLTTNRLFLTGKV